MSCQLDSGGKRLTSDHLGTVTSPPLPPRPVPQVTCRVGIHHLGAHIFNAGRPPPPPSPLPRARRLLSLGQFRSSSSTRCSRSTDSAMAGTPAASAQPRPSPSSRLTLPGLLALGIAGGSPCCASQPTNLGKRSQRAPDRHVSAARISQRATSGALQSKVRLQGKETNKKAPYLPSSPGTQGQGALGLGS